MRIIPLVAAALLVLATACDNGSADTASGGEPLIDNVRRAYGELPEMDDEWFLYQVGIRYEAEGDSLFLRNYSYLFTTRNASYYVVHIDAADEISSGPVAGRAMVNPPGYDFAANALSHSEAIDRAWQLYGEAVVDRCGPLRWVDVSGAVRTAGQPVGGQWWRVSYDSGPADNTIFLDAITGEVMERDEISCN